MKDLSKELSLGLPKARGLYNPDAEKDACGVGFICDIKGRPSRQIMIDAESMNCCMDHRGGLGYEKNSGDGAGILTALPHKFFSKAISIICMPRTILTRTSSSTILTEIILKKL